MGEAYEVAAPRLGLPRLPFVDWPDDKAAPVRGVPWRVLAGPSFLILVVT
jgi:hypothetical protein